MDYLKKIVILIVIIAIIDSIHGELSTLGYCIRQRPSPGFVSCMGQQALHTLQSLEDADNFTLTNGLVMVKDETAASMSRSLPHFLDQDPMDFRGILENAGAVISQRTLQWDMGVIYPGLTMRIGPSMGANSMLEFIMDQNHHVDDRTYLGDEPSTARILTKQLVLPFLLGLKFNLATLLPIVIAGLILLSKKALFLGKLALFLSSLFGFSSLFSFGGIASHLGFGDHHKYHHHHGSGGGLGLGLGAYGAHSLLNDNNYYKENKYQVSEKPELFDKFYDYEKKFSHKSGKMFERDVEPSNVDVRSNGGKSLELTPNQGYRNFAWHTIN